jgi:hypothetical protein
MFGFDNISLGDASSRICCDRESVAVLIALSDDHEATHLGKDELA